MSISISIVDLEKLADLSRLCFTHDQYSSLKVDMDGIIGLVNSLSSVEIGDVVSQGSLFSHLGHKSFLRGGVITESNSLLDNIEHELVYNSLVVSTKY